MSHYTYLDSNRYSSVIKLNLSCPASLKLEPGGRGKNQDCAVPQLHQQSSVCYPSEKKRIYNAYTFRAVTIAGLLLLLIFLLIVDYQSYFAIFRRDIVRFIIV